MAILPKIETTGSLIESQIIVAEKPRPYLGMSTLGEKCLRKLWYGFHWVSDKSITAKAQRIFNRGHVEEKVVVDDLKRIGVKCTKFIDGVELELTGEVDEEQEEFTGTAGHAKGHCDGRLLGLIEAPKTQHLLETKTMQEKYFKDVVKKGVQLSQPKYYSQVQRYMLATKNTPIKLERTFFVATNKNTQERYYERIRFNKEHACELERKEIQVVTSESPLIKVYNENDFECRYCSHKKVCHYGDSPNKNCRTCDNSDIMDNGVWHCNYWEKNLSYDEQLDGCKEWRIGWGL